MIKSALLFAGADGRQPATQGEVEQIGLCFLMASDLVLGYVPKPTDTFLQHVAGLMPFSDLLPRGTTMEDLVRHRLFLSEILQRPGVTSNALFQDVRETFASRCGLSYERFSALVFGAATKYMVAVSDEQLIGEYAYLLPNFFSPTNATKEELDAFFQLTAAGPEDLRTRLGGTQRATDFSPIQNTPLLRHPDGTHLCLDPGLLLDKAGRGLFWTIRSRLDDSEGERLKNFWGVLCEEYLHWLWEVNYLGKGQYFRLPCFTDGKPAFDACLLEHTTLTVFEYKASTLTAGAKHSFDADLFGNELEKKYAVFGPRAKGVGQLQRDLQRLCEGEQISGLDFSRVRKVFSVIVSFDEALVGLGVASYLDRLLHSHRRAMAKQTKKVFPPLFTALVSDIEYVLPYTSDVEFWAMLETFATAEPSRSGPLRNGMAKALVDYARGKDVIGERFEEIGANLAGLFY
jgi:hypothetical protein